MATLTNKALNTGSIANKAIGSSSLTFDETSPATFAEIVGTFDNPYAFSNKSLNTGSITNKAIS